MSAGIALSVREAKRFLVLSNPSGLLLAALRLSGDRLYTPGDLSTWKAPVVPLGTFEDHIQSTHLFPYVDSLGRRRTLTAEQHTRKGIQSLFCGRDIWLCETFPASPQHYDALGWDHSAVADALFFACCAIGPVDPDRIGFTPSARYPHRWMPTHEARR